MDKPLVTYEHGRLYVGRGSASLTRGQWKALAAWHDREKHDRYFDLLHDGIKLKSYVGVLRVGTLTIEVLPKLDDGQTGEQDQQHWRNRLLDMLSVTPEVSALHPTSAHLRTRPEAILPHYLRVLCDELEGLLRGGLTNAYHPRRGNRTALRGRLLLSRHLTENLLHRERFYVADQTYDRLHPLNQVLRQALDLALLLDPPADLRNRLAALDLRLPRLPKLRITPTLFDRLRYDRRTQAYRPAIGIARLLLLNFHPNLRNGRNDVLALLFNMNQLWEGFLLASLRKYPPADHRASGRVSERYWTGSGPGGASLRPDIGLYRQGKLVALLDAKWKRHQRPKPGDLQQLFTYAHHFAVARAALVYPAGEARNSMGGVFTASGRRGDVLWLSVRETGGVQVWMRELAAAIGDWLLTG